jgi:hypothetical protein
MKWYLTEDAKKKAAGVLGPDATIPDEPVDLGKLAQAVEDAFSDFSGKAQDLRDQIEKLLDVLNKWDDGLKDTAAMYDKQDFGLDKKKDAQKIAKGRKCFEGVGQTKAAYDRTISDIKKLQSQYLAAVKGRIP